MTCTRCAPCANCPCTEDMHRREPPRRCIGLVPLVIDSVSGPPRVIPRGCPCPGFTPKEEHMSTPDEPGQLAQEIVNDMHTITEVASAADTAIGELSIALAAARQVYADAVGAAHAAYLTAMTKIHHGAPAAPASPGGQS